MANPVVERIKEIKKNNNLTNDTLAEICKVSVETVKSMFSKNTNPSVDTLIKIHYAFPEYTLQWILTGANAVNSKNTILAENKVKGSIPYYADAPVSGGESGQAEVGILDPPTGYMSIPNVTAEKLFPVIGCSMLPRIKPGDVIGVNKVDRADRVEPDKIYMIITLYERMIKRLRIDRENNDILWCISDNENFKEFPINKSEIKYIYHVVYHGEIL